MTDKEKRKLLNKVKNFLLLNIYQYASIDVDYNVCIDRDELIKDLDKEIMGENNDK